MSNTINKLVLYVRANHAKIGPPLGTTLGNIGVNTAKFCKEFNDFTCELPDYYLLKTTIIITENKNFSFNVDIPSIGKILSMLKKQEIIKDVNGIILNTTYILLDDFIKIAKLKFIDENLYTSLKCVRGTLLSANIKVR